MYKFFFCMFVVSCFIVVVAFCWMQLLFACCRCSLLVVAAFFGVVVNFVCCSYNLFVEVLFSSMSLIFVCCSCFFVVVVFCSKQWVIGLVEVLQHLLNGRDQVKEIGFINISKIIYHAFNLFIHQEL